MPKTIITTTMDRDTPKTAPSRRTRGTLALLAGFAISIAAPAMPASAQVCLPELGCVPTLPVDECTADPASCLPSEPVDECVADPEACVTDVVEEEEEPEESAPAPQAGGSSSGGEDSNESGPSAGAGQQADRRDRAGRDPAPVRPAETQVREGGRRADTLAQPRPVAVDPPGTLARVVDAVAESGRRLAFPMALGVAVAMFLLVQGRIDRRDPKLALAPVDSRHDVLSFK